MLKDKEENEMTNFSLKIKIKFKSKERREFFIFSKEFKDLIGKLTLMAMKKGEAVSIYK